jgi:carbonic anhydrase
MRTIQWKCKANPGWQWLSGSAGRPGFPVDSDPMREGKVSLLPNQGYWFPCVELIAQGVAIANAYLRYFQEHGIDKIQAVVVAQGAWSREGNVDTKRSEIAFGGIELEVTFGESQQSPIAIEGSKAIRCSDESMPWLTIGWAPNLNGTVTNKSNGVKVKFTDAVPSRGTITLNGKTYIPDHFHLHSPAEHKYNELTPDIELHIVHTNQDGTYAVVALNFRKASGNPNPPSAGEMLDSECTFFVDLIAGLDKIASEGEVTSIPISTKPRELLPENHKLYYRYEGSLTTTPFSENVSWLIMYHTVFLRDDVVDELAKKYSAPARALQSMNRRLLLQNF